MEKPNISVDTDNLIKGWYQLPHHITKQLIPSIEKRPYAKLAFLFILLKTDGYRKTEARITFREMMAFTGASRSTLTRELAYLEFDLKLISRSQKYEGKDFTYTLNKYWDDKDLINDEKPSSETKNHKQKPTTPTFNLTPPHLKTEQGRPKIKLHIKETIKKNNFKKFNNKKTKIADDDFDYSEFSFGLNSKVMRSILIKSNLSKAELIDSARNFQNLLEIDEDKNSKISNKLAYFIAPSIQNEIFEKVSISEVKIPIQKNLIREIIINSTPGQMSEETKRLKEKLNESSKFFIESNGGIYSLSRAYEFEKLLKNAS